jgi:transcriptional/translational regulatory protein YebC/TACO1
MAEPGSVGWQFVQKGYIAIPSDKHDFEEVFMIAADAGADDAIDGEDLIEIITSRETLQAVEEALQAAGIELDEARLEWVPKVALDLGQDEAFKVMGVVEQLEELDDIQNVYSNLNVTDELMAAFETA